jgi:hypothetical protein
LNFFFAFQLRFLSLLFPFLLCLCHCLLLSLTSTRCLQHFTCCVDCALLETCNRRRVGYQVLSGHTRETFQKVPKEQHRILVLPLARTKAIRRNRDVELNFEEKHKPEQQFFFFPLLRLSSLGWTWIERRNCRSISIACQCHSTYSPRARPSNTLARLAFDDRNKGKLNHVTMEKRARERSEKC